MLARAVALSFRFELVTAKLRVIVKVEGRPRASELDAFIPLYRVPVRSHRQRSGAIWPIRQAIVTVYSRGARLDQSRTAREAQNMADSEEERIRKELEQEKIEKRSPWPRDEACSGCGQRGGHTANCPNR